MEKLYTREVLALAVQLADFPLDENAPLRASAHSQICGSTIIIGIRLNPAQTIEEIGLQSKACAIGQAAAAIFAQSARGKTGPKIAQARREIAHWLSSAVEQNLSSTSDSERENPALASARTEELPDELPDELPEGVLKNLAKQQPIALPDWDGFSTIEAAREYPGRHGAILLPWDAALQALSNP